MLPNLALRRNNPHRMGASGDVMDPRAPKIASASLVFGVILVVLSISSYAFKLGLSDGFGFEEAILLGLSAVLFLVWFIASRERREMEMISTPTAEEQFEAVESMPTKFRSATTDVDQYSFETKSTTSEQSKSIVESILGESKTVEASDIGNAYAALTSDPNSEGSQQVKSNPAPHRHTAQNREVIKPSRSSQDPFQRTEISNIPLPGQVDSKETPDLPWLSTEHKFQTSGVGQIPLPVEEPSKITTSPVVAAPVMVPEMPNLDDLFNEEPTPVPKHQLKTPVLPNLDDLF